jgi:hypothetical protein
MLFEFVGVGRLSPRLPLKFGRFWSFLDQILPILDYFSRFFPFVR